MKYQFYICTDYRALGVIVRDLGGGLGPGLLVPASKGKGCEEQGTGNAHQQLGVELVVLFWGSTTMGPCLRGLPERDGIHHTEAGQRHLCQQDG